MKSLALQQWRDSRVANILALAREGKGGPEISEALLCSVTTIYAVLHRDWPNRPKVLCRRSKAGADWWAANDRVGTLTRLWASGLSASRIAMMMSCTRNAVIGKARRLALTPRPSPIKHRSPSEHSQAIPAPKVAPETNRAEQ